MNLESTPATLRPAHNLARAKTFQTFLAGGYALSVLANVAMMYYSYRQAHREREVVVFDLSSGTLLVSPLVDPGSSKTTIDTTATWAVECVWDRSPDGLDHPELLNIIFDKSAAPRVRDEFDKVKQVYVEKKLLSHVRVKSIDGVPIGNGHLKVRVTGEVDINGVVHGGFLHGTQPGPWKKQKLPTQSLRLPVCGRGGRSE
jgi:hypothetical protein